MAEVIADLKLVAENNNGQKLKNNAGLLRLSFLCAALLLNEMHPPMNFQIDTSNTIKMSSRQKV
jgi:hypothetical protein